MTENPMLVEDAVEREFDALLQQRLFLKDQQSSVPRTGKIDADTTLLQKRVQEVRENELRRSAAELLYVMVCRTFADACAPMVEPMKTGGAINLNEAGLRPLMEGLYSANAAAVVQDHITKSIGSGQGDQIVHLALFAAGQLYATSCLFGYFVHRVDQRYKLEKQLLQSSGSLQEYIDTFGPGQWGPDQEGEIASKEAQAAMHMQIQALFGDLQHLRNKISEQLGPLQPGEVNARLQQAMEKGTVEAVKLRLSNLRTLMEEALTFGASLHIAETQARDLYELTPASGRHLDRFGVRTDEEGNPLLPD